jgi:hypothetical protein
MKQKNAQGHVEMIISFVMFVGAVMFIFMYINPISKNQETFSISDKIQGVLIENISTSMGKVYVIANESNGCYNISEFILSYGNNFREVQDSQNPRVYVIYFSPLFDHNAPHNLNDCPETNYTLTAYSNERVIFYEYIQDLKLNYDNDYNNLKKQLGITNDFLFSVYDLKGTKIEEISVDKNIPSGINVESYELPIRVINRSADINPYILKINAW